MKRALQALGLFLAGAAILSIPFFLCSCSGTRIRSDWLTIERCAPAAEIQGTDPAPIYEWEGVADDTPWK